jgi:hypothetical protein
MLGVGLMGSVALAATNPPKGGGGYGYGAGAAGYAQQCKPGWGFGDTNHCHSGPPGQLKKLGTDGPVHGPHGRPFMTVDPTSTSTSDPSTSTTEGTHPKGGPKHQDSPDGTSTSVVNPHQHAAPTSSTTDSPTTGAPASTSGPGNGNGSSHASSQGQAHGGGHGHGNGNGH